MRGSFAHEGAEVSERFSGAGACDVAVVGQVAAGGVVVVVDFAHGGLLV